LSTGTVLVGQRDKTALKSKGMLLLLPTTDAVLLFLLLVHGSILLLTIKLNNSTRNSSTAQEAPLGLGRALPRSAQSRTAQPANSSVPQPSAALQLTSGITAVIQSSP